MWECRVIPIACTILCLYIPAYSDILNYLSAIYIMITHELVA